MKRLIILLFCISVFVGIGVGISGCANQSTDGINQMKDRDMTVYQAEEGTLLGKAVINNVMPGFTGDGYVDNISDEGDGIELTVQIDSDGFYDLNFRCATAGGYKQNYVLVDGISNGVVVIEEDAKGFVDCILNRVYLSKGEHKVSLTKYWGWMLVDCLQIYQSEELDEDMYDVPAKLCNKNADDNTKRLMSYLCDNYGENFLSGQYCDGGMFGIENATIWKATGGKYPAVLGLDFIEYSPSRVKHGSKGDAVEKAIEYWEAGGIVTFCWHWNAPEQYLTGTWYRGFYAEETNIDLAKIMNGEDQEGYELLLSDIDAIAKELQILEDAGVPILWRPLHEASGGWFWWGNAGAEAYKKLYVLLYDKLVNEYGLNNLIWIWNGQQKDWYPGDEYVDIIGEDIYPGEHVYTSQAAKYLEAVDYTETKKMVVLSENGCLFDPDLAIRDGAMWGFFATWGGEFVSTNSKLNVLSEQYTEAYMLQKIYNHERVINRDELPDLKTYPIRTDANE